MHNRGASVVLKVAPLVHQLQQGSAMCRAGIRQAQMRGGEDVARYKNRRRALGAALCRPGAADSSCCDRKRLGNHRCAPGTGPLPPGSGRLKQLQSHEPL